MVVRSDNTAKPRQRETPAKRSLHFPTVSCVPVAIHVTISQTCSVWTPVSPASNSSSLMGLMDCDSPHTWSMPFFTERARAWGYTLKEYRLPLKKHGGRLRHAETAFHSTLPRLRVRPVPEKGGLPKKPLLIVPCLKPLPALRVVSEVGQRKKGKSVAGLFIVSTP